MLKFLEHDVPDHFEKATGKKRILSSYYLQMTEFVRNKEFHKLLVLKSMMQKDMRILDNVISLTSSNLDYKTQNFL